MTALNLIKCLKQIKKHEFPFVWTYFWITIQYKYDAHSRHEFQCQYQSLGVELLLLIKSQQIILWPYYKNITKKLSNQIHKRQVNTLLDGFLGKYESCARSIIMLHIWWAKVSFALHSFALLSQQFFFEVSSHIAVVSALEFLWYYQNNMCLL